MQVSTLNPNNESMSLSANYTQKDGQYMGQLVVMVGTAKGWKTTRYNSEIWRKTSSEAYEDALGAVGTADRERVISFRAA
jgi:hypothetical protein